MKVEIDKRDFSNVKIVCEEPIPTLFADGVHGIALVNNSMRINLYEDKFDPITGDLTRHIIARVALNLDVFNSFIDVSMKVREELKASQEKEAGQKND